MHPILQLLPEAREVPQFPFPEFAFGSLTMAHGFGKQFCRDGTPAAQEVTDPAAVI
jgi:hypothetical protein